MTKRVFAAALVAGVYLLMLASLDPVDVAIAVVVGAVLVLGLAEVLFPGGDVGVGDLARRSARFVPFAAAVVWDIVRGTWDVALVVLHVRPLRSPGIVAIPIGERTPTGVVATALLLTLAPGEFLVDVDRERGVLLVHVLDASDPDAVRARHARYYDRYQRKVFP